MEHERATCVLAAVDYELIFPRQQFLRVREVRIAVALLSAT